MRILTLAALAAAAASLAGCASYPIPTPIPDPVMANPPPRPPGFENKGWGGSAGSGGSGPFVSATDTGSINGIAKPENSIVDVRAGIVFTAAPQNVPGAPDPWNAIQDKSIRRREEIVTTIDSSLGQLAGQMAVQKMTLPIPGLEADHDVAVARFQNAMREVQQKREQMATVSDPGIFETTKQEFHEAWQAAENAYSQARATGN